MRDFRLLEYLEQLFLKLVIAQADERANLIKVLMLVFLKELPTIVSGAIIAAVK